MADTLAVRGGSNDLSDFYMLSVIYDPATGEAERDFGPGANDPPGSRSESNSRKAVRPRRSFGTGRSRDGTVRVHSPDWVRTVSLR